MNARGCAKVGMAVGVLALVGAVAPAEIAGGPHQGGRGVKHSSRTKFFAQLHGGNEVPSIFSSGRGTAVFRINDEAETIDYTLRYDNLEAEATAAHVHFAQADVNGGVMFFLCGGALEPCPTPGGEVTGTVGAADILGPEGQGIAAGEFAKAVAAIRAGLSYANVHSELHPGGEIRGQLR